MKYFQNIKSQITRKSINEQYLGVDLRVFYSDNIEAKKNALEKIRLISSKNNNSSVPLRMEEEIANLLLDNNEDLRVLACEVLGDIGIVHKFGPAGFFTVNTLRLCLYEDDSIRVRICAIKKLDELYGRDDSPIGQFNVHLLDFKLRTFINVFTIEKNEEILVSLFNPT